jgi:nuclear transport factor 2 (NTF2) superfamily protein
MRPREESIGDVSIAAAARKFHLLAPGPRPSDDTGIYSVR